MQAIVFTVQVDADTFSNTMDGRVGYPKAGVGGDGRVYPSPGYGSTTKHGQVVKHPTSALWAYPFDAKVQTEQTKGLIIPITGSVQTLDPTWFPNAV